MKSKTSSGIVEMKYHFVPSISLNLNIYIVDKYIRQDPKYIHIVEQH